MKKIKVPCRMKWCYNPTRTEDGECDKWCFYNTQEILTNADRIRKMNDEELARWINNNFSKYNLYNEWLEWLRKEV